MGENIFDREYFPDSSLAGEDGLLAAGGTLESEVLLEAYSKGIFPWYSENTPVLWWSPDPRMILFPDRFRISKSLSRTIRNAEFEVRRDSSFNEVIEHCARLPRPAQEGTWITREMIDAYIRLHEEGYAHSFEIFKQGKLVGGLYGISMGRAFFGESMFHLERDASKVALYHLVKFAVEKEFDLIDAQQSTDHLRSLGAEEIARQKFMDMLKKTMIKDTLTGSWS